MRKSLLILCMALICMSTLAQAQTRVTGVVTSAADGAPIPGASILIKGTTKGISTGANGSYTLDNVQSGAVLVFSSIGFQTIEAQVNGRSTINIALQSSDKSLDEVIVVAYGTSTKGTYTGAASVVKGETIKNTPVTSFESTLNGRVAGVQVTASSGQAGAVSNIRIRGIGSMTASNEPLYVIDGVPVTSGDVGQMKDYTFTTNNVMSSLNPADIESITVLKDAAASSLYGSRAANGVVLITTKKGKTGKPVVNLKSSIGLTPSWATDNYEAASIQEQTNMLYRLFHDIKTSDEQDDAAGNKEALRQLNNRFNKHGYKFSTIGTGLNENVIITGMTDGIENREGKYFNWEDALFRTAIYQTNDLSVGGGDDNTTYYSSLSYTKDQSRVKINNFDRVGGRINLGQKVGKHVEFISNVNITRTGQEGFNDTRNSGANYYYQSRNLLWPFYWPTDYKTGQPYTARFGSLAQNAVYYDNEWENSSITRRILANETLNIKILPELNLKSVASYDNSQVKDHVYFSALHFNGSATKGAVHELTTNISKLVSSTTLNYAKQFGLHNIGLLAGFEAEKNETDVQRSSGTDLPASALHTVATAGILNSNAYTIGNNMMSMLSRAEYNYNQRYYASGSLRRDGSSKLGPDTRWGNFFSVAGAWRISQESFMQNMHYISNLRLRASYGTNGTLPPTNYGWRTLTGYTLKYMGQAGGGVTNIVDPNVTWEKSYTSNIALEFGLFKNRLTGTVEYFNRDSKDLIQDVNISMTTGFFKTLKNIGEINNKGLELELGGDIISRDNFRWSASVNASFVKSKVTKLYRINGQAQDRIWLDPTGDDDRSQFIFREGESTLAFYGYEWAGVNPENGQNVWYKNGGTGEGSDPDALSFNGREATYNYSRAAQVILGDANPDVYGGINTDVAYKGFSLSLNFNYKIGGKLYDGAFKDVADDGYYFERIRAQEYYDNMWTAENKNGTLPKIRGVDLTDAMQFSSRQMYDASFLRLKNVTLGYNLPKQLLNKIGVNNTRVYFNGSNLLTFSKYKIADPEVNQYGTRGWETPFGKTYTFGIEFSF
jgi:TonB-linked SusC/RagA family outer membrane protein